MSIGTIILVSIGFVAAVFAIAWGIGLIFDKLEKDFDEKHK